MRTIYKCSECEKLLSDKEWKHNRERGIEEEDYHCWACEIASDPE